MIGRMVLYDFEGRGHEVDVDLDDESIVAAILQVVSGDEVLDVVYEDGTILTFDADASGRYIDRLDATYILVLNGEWMVDREGFFDRKGAYDDGWAREGRWS